MRRELLRAVSSVRPENRKRVQYFAAISKKLKLIDIYEDLLQYFGESEDDEYYEALEDLRQEWRKLEIKDIRSRLEQLQYRLQDIEYVNLVLGSRRLEHVSILPPMSMSNSCAVWHVVNPDSGVHSLVPTHEDRQNIPPQGRFAARVRRHA